MRTSLLMPRRGTATLLSLNKGPQSLTSLARHLQGATSRSPVLSLAPTHNIRQVRCFGTTTRNFSGAANDTKSYPTMGSEESQTQAKPSSSSAAVSSSCGDSCVRSDDPAVASAPIDTRVGRFLFTGTPNEFIELVHLSDVLVVNFTAKWCKPCIEIEPEWVKLIQYFTYQRKGSKSAAVSGDEGTTSPTEKTTSAEKEALNSSEGNGITVTFVDVDISVNDTLSALHDVRCVPTYGCYIGGRGGRGRRTEESGGTRSLDNGRSSGPDSANAADGGSMSEGGADISKPTSSSVASPDDKKNVNGSEGEAKQSTSSGLSSSAPTAELGYESRGLFGTVEGAHLNKVHDMIEAAIIEIAKEKREGLFVSTTQTEATKKKVE